ncbi:ABC transporter permease subunit [Clostridium guangxiense]|uniref:ABC transporter permease subunit n=1 Tax=Clostridium guangxiense TaxID=1662055 RepID=UPI001E373DDE|nr:ABC transporter permease [Clostridium guangxiense]MCD2346792.1 ABC transporter permease [Clostridium guangxiense]
MWGLISNELYKIIKKKKFWVTLIVFAAILFLFGFFQYSNQKKYRSPEKRIEMTKTQIETNKKSLQSGGISANERKKVKQTIVQEEQSLKKLKKDEEDKNVEWTRRVEKDLRANKEELIKAKTKGKNEDIDNATTAVSKDQYYLDNNVDPYSETGKDVFSAFLNTKAFIEIIIVFMIIAVATSDIVSSEYSPATIKMLLAKPVSRFKILLSKFIAIFIANSFLIIIPQLLLFIALGTMDGFPNMLSPVTAGTKYQYDKAVIATNNQIGVSPIVGSTQIVSYAKYLLYVTGIDLLFIATCVSICFLISVLIKNSGIAIGSSVGIGLAMSILGIMMLQGSLPAVLEKVSPYLPMTYASSDMLVYGYLAKTIDNPSITMDMGVGVLVFYTIVCFVISSIVFMKRDMLA